MLGIVTNSQKRHLCYLLFFCLLVLLFRLMHPEVPLIILEPFLVVALIGTFRYIRSRQFQSTNTKSTYKLLTINYVYTYNPFPWSFRLALHTLIPIFPNLQFLSLDHPKSPRRYPFSPRVRSSWTLMKEKASASAPIYDKKGLYVLSCRLCNSF